MGSLHKDLPPEKVIFEKREPFQIGIVSLKKSPPSPPKKEAKKIEQSKKQPSKRFSAFSKVLWPQFFKKWSSLQIRWNKNLRTMAFTKVSSPLKKSNKTSFSVPLKKESLKESKTTNSNFSTDLEWFFSTPALFFYSLFALFYFGIFYSESILNGLRGIPRLQIQLHKPVWICHSPWTQKIPIWASLETLPHPPFLFEKKLLPHLQQTFEKSAWLKNVRIERVFPNRIRVLAQVRKPCLAIRLENQCIFVDSEGVRIPYIAEVIPDVFFLEGVQTSPPQIGEQWKEPGLIEACKLAMFLKKQNVHQWVPLQSIRFEKSIFTPETAQTPDCTFTLRTTHQTEIYWGRSEQSHYVHTSNRSKICLLQQFCQQYPALKGLKSADLRFEEESFVCVSQTN